MNPPPNNQFQAPVPIQGMSGDDPTARAVGNAGRALQQSANLAMQLDEEQNLQYRTDAELIMRRESAKLAGELALNKNPATHTGISKERFDSVKAGILNDGDFSPKVRAMISEGIDRFTIAKLEKIGTDAKLMQVENGRRLQKSRMELYAQDGEFDMARGVAKEGVGTYWGKEQAEIMEMKLEQKEKFFHMENALSKDPAEAERLLEDSEFGFPETEKARYREKAKAAQKRAEASEMNRIMGAVAIGSVETKNDLAKALESSPNVTPMMAKKALKSWDERKPISFEEKSGLTSRMNSLHDQFSNGEISRENYARGHHELASEVYALGSRDGTGGLRQRLHALDPTKWNGNNLKAGKETQSEMIIEGLSKTWHGAGGFGRPVKGEDKLTPVEALQVEEAQILTELAMKEWLKTEEGKKATRQEIKRQFMREAASSMTGMEIQGLDSDPTADLEGILGAGNTMLPKQ